MARFVLATFLALSCTFSYAQNFVKIFSDKSAYEEGETAHLRYRLAALPESPGYEFFLSASLGAETLEIKKITETEFYSRLESLSSGNKTVAVNIYLQDKNLAAALVAALKHHESEISRLTDEILEADPEDVPALEEELALHQARRANASSRLNEIRRFVSGPHTLQFQVN